MYHQKTCTLKIHQMIGRTMNHPIPPVTAAKSQALSGTLEETN
jgi:hypothetical protein